MNSNCVRSPIEELVGVDAEAVEVWPVLGS
jgi:hypothetical protein